jgi:hypothetical protein
MTKGQKRRVDKAEQAVSSRTNTAPVASQEDLNDARAYVDLIITLRQEHAAGNGSAGTLVNLYVKYLEKPSKALSAKIRKAEKAVMAWREKHDSDPLYCCPNNTDRDGNVRRCRFHPPCGTQCEAGTPMRERPVY